MKSAEPPGGRDDLSGFVGHTLKQRYRVDEVLGSGGMGTVYLAWDQELGRHVALKAAHPSMLLESGFRERFATEIRHLIKLEHPSITKVFDLGDYNGVPFVVLQYLAGGSLADQMSKNNKHRSPREILRWLPTIARSLDFIHEHHYLHRDVKPGNILFDSQGHPYLADFGIAKAVGATNTQLTRTGMTPGSPHYMAPEAAMGQSCPESDQYSLAVVVYEMLAGRKPFSGDSSLHVLIKKNQEDAPDLTSIAPHVPAATCAVVMRALQRDSTGRFSNCQAFSAAFVQSLKAKPDSTTVAAPKPTPLRCPACTKLLGVPENLHGKTIRCPACQTVLQVAPDQLVLAGADPDVADSNAPLFGAAESGPAADTVTPTKTVSPANTVREAKRVAPVKKATSTRKNTAAKTVRHRPGRQRKSRAAGRFIRFVFGTAILAAATGLIVYGVAQLPPRTDLLANRDQDDDTNLPPDEQPEGQAETPLPEDSVETELDPGEDSGEPDTPDQEDSRIPAILTSKSTGMKLKLLPPGEFQMGAPDSSQDSDFSDAPQHAVTLSKPLYMAITEVTQGQWEAVMGTSPWTGEVDAEIGTERAASYVSWDDAEEFCSRLSLKDGRTYRLPTEAEWEYACRANSNTKYTFGDSVETLKQYAWFRPFSDKSAQPVGQKLANEFGMFDMHGNVWEWCSDFYFNEFYEESPDTDPTGPQSGLNRVVRGGSWDYAARYCRSAFRYTAAPTVRHSTMGFRVCSSVN